MVLGRGDEVSPSRGDRGQEGSWYGLRGWGWEGASSTLINWEGEKVYHVYSASRRNLRRLRWCGIDFWGRKWLGKFNIRALGLLFSASVRCRSTLLFPAQNSHWGTIGMRRHNDFENSSIKADHSSKPPARRHVGFSTPVGQQCGCWFWDLGLFLFTFLRPLCLINGLSTKNSLHLGQATTSGGRIRPMVDSSKLLFV